MKSFILYFLLIFSNLLSAQTGFQPIPNKEYCFYIPKTDTIIPSITIRSNIYYWNGQWWTEYDYLSRDEIKPLCLLSYFSDGTKEVLWLSNLKLSDNRFKRIAKEFSYGDFYARCCGTSTDIWGFTKFESMQFVSPSNTQINLEKLRNKILLTILNTRKQ